MGKGSPQDAYNLTGKLGGHWRSTRKVLEGRRELGGAMKGESGPGFTVRKWRGS